MYYYDKHFSPGIQAARMVQKIFALCRKRASAPLADTGIWC
jgi:hypothetical protein